MTRARRGVARVEVYTSGLDLDNQKAQPIYDAKGVTSRTAASETREARQRADRVMDTCEPVIERSVKAGQDGADHRFITYVKRMAARVRDEMGRGLITRDALFTFDYRPLLDTDPIQHDAPFARFVDLVVQDLLKEASGYDPAMIFCAICDRDCYIPTHKQKFSRPPRPDQAWNAAHCRSKRVFSDRVRRKARANRATFLLQIYRRDMGAEGFVMMKGISVPLHVASSHWVRLRMGYRQVAKSVRQ